MNDLLTNREISSLLLTVAAFTTIAVLAARKERGFVSTVGGVIRTLFQWKLLVSLMLFLTVIGITILLAHKIGLWNSSLWKPTGMWLLLAGVGLHFNTNDVLKQPTFFRDKLKHTLGFGAVVEFIASLESFPLGIEISIQLPAAILAMMTFGHRDDPIDTNLRKVTKVYFVLLGISAIIWTGWSTEWTEVDHTNFLLELFLPVWLTATAILYLYPLALFATHETTSTRMRIFTRARHKRRRYRKLTAMVLRSGLSLRAARTIGNYAGIIVEADGFRSAWREASTSLRKDRERIEAERAAQRRLVENAGLVGSDRDGKQLDQREHAETKKALRWLATCQMGHYRNLQRYRNDEVFVAIIRLTSEQHGLPTPTDIRLHVSADGQSWYSERKTITGHWFAIGAAESPTDQWLYDGATKPVGFPNDREWDQWASGEHSLNWEER